MYVQISLKKRKTLMFRCKKNKGRFHDIISQYVVNKSKAVASLTVSNED